MPFGLLAYSGAGISIGICFSKVIVLTVLSVLGITLGTFNLNPHLQAVLMWLFAALAVVRLALDKDRCGSTIPLAMGMASLAIIVGTLYTYYQDVILMTGYAILVVAALLNQSLRLKHLNQQVERQAESLKELDSALETNWV